MNAPVIIGAGGPERLGGGTRTASAQLWHRAATVLRKFQHAGRTVRLAILGAAIFARVKGRGGWQATTRHHAPQILTGRARFEPLQKPARGLLKCFHVSCSAFAFHEQKQTTGVIANVRKVVGEIQHVER